MWVKMLMDQNMLIALVSSLLMLILGPLIKDIILVSKKIWSFLCTLTKYLVHNDTLAVDSVVLDDNISPPAQLACGGGLTSGDIEIVTARLGLTRFSYQGCEGLGVVEELMDGKQASQDELEEAFCIFDRDEDGFICTGELWNVMRRLGWKEGAMYEDCVRMIRAFDEDGDGKISFLEFRRMMENAV
ncbi:calmodulin-like protein 3 [Hordeum vulgare subsp. vulgare]|uniref:EF-hand domain-containing protein n=1 Tax=Hordeum vulgare subsp. vulgare TaxID=112509 RepID=A0A8I7B1S6_HORVV|nr:calmodulin-like protein 3 [Hordeum vulgare subsp. vulgare]